MSSITPTDEKLLASRPTEKEIVVYSQRLDGFRAYLTDNPTPERMTALLRRVDAGEIGVMYQLQEEMEAKDAHIQGVANVRRASLTELDWSIEPYEFAREQDKNAAAEAAAFCQEELRDLSMFDESLHYLSRAIGPNIASVETHWANKENKIRVVGMEPVPGARLMRDFYTPDILITTDNAPLGEAMPPGKFVTFQPYPQPFAQFHVTMTRATVFLWLLKKLGADAWGIFAELYGMPWRIGYYNEDLANNTEVLGKLKQALKQLSFSGWAMFPDGVRLEFQETRGGETVHKALLQWAQDMIAILWRGQTLTTEVGAVGSKAAAQVHMGVASTLNAQDRKAERFCIREQLLRPMVRYGFSETAPIPSFKRIVVEDVNVEEARLKLEQMKFVGDRGLPIDDDTVYAQASVPKPKMTKNTEEQTTITFNELTLALERLTRLGDLEVINATRKKIGDLLSQDIAPLTVLPALAGSVSDAPIQNDQPEEPPAAAKPTTKKIAASTPTLRETILKSIVARYRSIDELAEIHGVTTSQARGVISAPDVRPLLETMQDGNRLLYRRIRRAKRKS